MKKNWAKKLAWAWLLFCGLNAIFCRFIANERPLWLQHEGKSYFLALEQPGESLARHSPNLDALQRGNRWHTLSTAQSTFAPIPFSAGKFWQDSPGQLLPPGSQHPARPARYRHWLGTDAFGRDVAAAFVHGSRVAILTGLWASSLSLFLGLLFGCTAGYFGDNRLYLSRYSIFFGLFSLPFAYFCGFIALQWPLQEQADARAWATSLGLFAMTISVFLLLGRGLAQKWAFMRKKICVPADMILMRFTEIVNSVPRLMLIIATAALWKDKGSMFWAIITIIGLFGWTGVARFARAELLKVRENHYVEAAKGLGLRDWTVFRRHALPNIFAPIKLVVTIGIGTAIAIEASISFLGYGDPAFNGATWGGLLNAYRDDTQAWWLLLVPFCGICFTLLSLQEISENTSTSLENHIVR
jgi:peptide/nickel transport system permease protein